MTPVKIYPRSKSLRLFFGFTFLLSIGAAIGWMRKLKAKVPATVLKSEVNV